MKNEADFVYEAWLCHTGKLVCASLHTEQSEVLHNAEGVASHRASDAS